MTNKPITARILRWSDAYLVPNAPGIYAFHNTATKAIYVGATGSLQRRFGQWRAIIVHEVSAHRADRKMRQEISVAPRDGWMFTVLVEVSKTTTRAELFQLERHAIQKASQAVGDRCLNETHYLKR